MSDHSAPPDDGIPERLKRRAAAAQHHDRDVVDDDDDDSPILLSNRQVMEILQKRVETRSSSRSNNNNNNNKPLKRYQHRDWIEREVVHYVQSTPASLLPENNVGKKLQQRLRQKPFELTEAEALQCVNLVPRLPVELFLVVEDLNERLTARRQEELLALIQEYCEQKQQQTDVDDVKQKEGPQQNGVYGEANCVKRIKEEDLEEDKKPAAVEKTNGAGKEIESPKKKSRWR